MSGPLLLLDAPSLYFRAFFGVPKRFSPDGTQINAAAGFIDWTARLVIDRKPDRIACCMDFDWRPAWRVALIPSYKTHRVDGASGPGGGAPPGQAEPPELGAQVPVIVDAMTAAGIPVVGLDGYEADDVIATLALREPGPTEIVTGDRDLFQLVRDPDVRVLYPRRGVTEMDVVDESWVSAKYGIPGRAYADLAILRGDASDGLPGVRGVGEKTAASLIAKYGSLEGVVTAADERPLGPLAKVKMSRDYLQAAIPVVRLPHEIGLPSMDLTRPREPSDPDALLALAKRWGIPNPLKRLVDALQS